MKKKYLIVISILFVIAIFVGIIYFIIEKEDAKINLQYEIIKNIPTEVKFDKETKGTEIVEFNNEYYVFVKLGTHNTGGYNIEIETIETKGRKAYIYVKTSTDRGPVSMAFTYPYVAIKFNERPKIKVMYNHVKINRGY